MYVPENGKEVIKTPLFHHCPEYSYTRHRVYWSSKTVHQYRNPINVVFQLHGKVVRHKTKAASTSSVHKYSGIYEWLCKKIQKLDSMDIGMQVRWASDDYTGLNFTIPHV